MANIIAIIWDFDKTLIKGYMQDPIFKEYGVESTAFWDEVNALPKKYQDEQGVKVNPDTIYLNHFINYAKQGKFSGLNNAKLREFGKQQDFYPGVPEIFEETKKAVNDNIYREYDIRVEHYIVSTGIAEIIKGSEVAKHVDGIWGCEFIEVDAGNGEKIIGEVGYSLDSTTKTRALFEINKGVGKQENIDVNMRVPEEYRRVHFINMVYVADGPSDIPAFSIINRHGGATFAVYPAGNYLAMEQVEQMRKDGRINMFAEADYSKDKTACMWLCSKVREFAERIREEERAKIARLARPPKHLI